MRRTVLLLFCCLIAITCTSFCDSMSQEEAAVRKAYAKTILAVQLHTLYELTFSTEEMDAATIERHLEAEKLTFDLSDFKVGDISELKSVKYAELVTKPSGFDVLEIGPATVSLTNDKGEKGTTDMALARWTEGQTSMGTDWNIPASDNIAMVYAKSPIHVTRYASYAVTVKFKGRQQSYRALFLFGTDEHGGAYMNVVDTVANINGVAVSHFITHPIRAGRFTVDHTEEMSTIRDWMKAHSPLKCPADAEDACCDPSTMTCAVGLGQ
jgi:hypothetical protein